MKKISPFLFLLLSAAYCLYGCSQKYGITRAYAYIRETTAGNIRVDENNRPTGSGINKSHLIYVETAIDKEPPVWETAWVDNKLYGIQAVAVQTTDLALGKMKNKNKDVVISVKPGNQLWQLVLNDEQTQPLDSLKRTAGIVLRGRWKKKPFSYHISKEQQLAGTFTQ